MLDPQARSRDCALVGRLQEPTGGERVPDHAVRDFRRKPRGSERRRTARVYDDDSIDVHDTVLTPVETRGGDDIVPLLV